MNIIFFQNMLVDQWKPNTILFKKEKYGKCNGDELLKACSNLLTNNEIEEAWQVLHLGKVI